ncbi:MAG: ABC transporter ATP-binding protein [Myxococcota bacterium]|nr:ABC transporter ATP-binding protein [Myxococcota bacterium]
MLSISNLEVVYHSVVLVLKGLSLKVPEGEIVALLGPNGAGKTTALRAMTGLLPVHDGKVTKGSMTFNGQSLVGRSSESSVQLGLAQVMEGRRIFSELSVEENLLVGGHSQPWKQVQSDIEKYYERFPVLGQRRRQPAGYLSGGEQQMLAITRALMARPRLLLLDEPSLGLAPKIVKEVAELIRAVNQEGVGILLVEQNASLAFDLANYAYVLENGKVVIDGDCATLQEDEDIREFYMGIGGESAKSYRDVKLYRRRKRWLS